MPESREEAGVARGGEGGEGEDRRLEARRQGLEGHRGEPEAWSAVDKDKAGATGPTLTLWPAFLGGPARCRQTRVGASRHPESRE